MNRDRAAVVAIVIGQLVKQVGDPAELRRTIADYLRDEFTDIERQIAGERREGEQ